MKKVSIFVEGQTERIFLEKLLSEYFTSGKLKTVSCRLIGDRLTQILELGNKINPEFYVLIYDVGGDERAVSVMLERADAMINSQGYNFLFAVRDLNPELSANKNALIDKIERLFATYAFRGKVRFIFAIKEIEAWFLGDYNFFSRIHPSLTPEYIQSRTGYNLVNDNPEDYDKPAQIIDDILKLIGQRYKKKAKDAYRITHRIDYSFLCIDVPARVRSFAYFLNCIDQGIAN
ncbi:MAG: DUF4276 family protein [Candidatus Omnitrophota bacterium]|nr:DUF4276 family protein [Candidatus Omnitrophota bacterium]